MPHDASTTFGPPPGARLRRPRACAAAAAALALLLAGPPAHAGEDTLVLTEKLLHDFSSEVREDAAIKLGYKPGPGVCEALVDALKDVDPGVRAAAARSLGKVGDVTALEPLEGATKDREELVVSEARRALKKLSSRPLAPAPPPSDDFSISGGGLASKRKPEELDKLYQRLAKPLVRCVSRHARRHAGFKGVTVRFTVLPDGRAERLVLPELTEPAPKLEKCVGALLDKVRLKPAAGGELTVSWPLMLAP